MFNRRLKKRIEELERSVKNLSEENRKFHKELEKANHMIEFPPKFKKKDLTNKGEVVDIHVLPHPITMSRGAFNILRSLHQVIYPDGAFPPAVGNKYIYVYSVNMKCTSRYGETFNLCNKFYESDLKPAAQPSNVSTTADFHGTCN